jgi:hypothetical protein
MKHKTYFIIGIGILAVFLSIKAFGTEDVSSMSPSVFVPAPEHQFKPVVDGTKVTHEFVLKNKGNVVLAIEKVVTG